jgi:lipopolysaccharide transport system ATP-binding protein
MTHPAIRAEKVSKRFRLGTRQTSYRTLRETITDTVKAPLRWATGRGGSASAGDDELWALRDVSFEIKHGDVVGVIGRNGAGKSTLLKILSRITDPTEGRVAIHGRVGSLLEVGTGFHPELTGRENIYLYGAILGMKMSEIAAKFDEIVAFAEVDKFIETPVKHYSSGMYMRLAFAVAAHLEPEILLVDEVLAVGDAIFQKKCLGKMGEVSRHGRTVFLVSHNIGAILSLCTKGLLFHKGQLLREGPIEEVARQYVGMGLQDSPVVSYPENTQSEIQILRVSLLDHERKPTTQLDILRPFSVEIEYAVHTPVAGVVISANILTSMNESIISTCDHDMNRAKLSTRTVGVHKTSVTFPSKLFNSGGYNLVVGISIPGKVIYDRKEVLYYEMIDTGSFVCSGGGEERRNALLLLELPWNE